MIIIIAMLTLCYSITSHAINSSRVFYAIVVSVLMTLLMNKDHSTWGLKANLGLWQEYILVHDWSITLNQPRSLYMMESSPFLGIHILIRWNDIFDALIKDNTAWGKGTGLNQNEDPICFLGVVSKLLLFLAQVNIPCEIGFRLWRPRPLMYNGPKVYKYWHPNLLLIDLLLV